MKKWQILKLLVFRWNFSSSIIPLISEVCMFFLSNQTLQLFQAQYLLTIKRVFWARSLGLSNLTSLLCLSFSTFFVDVLIKATMKFLECMVHFFFFLINFFFATVSLSLSRTFTYSKFPAKNQCKAATTAGCLKFIQPYYYYLLRGQIP